MAKHRKFSCTFDDKSREKIRLLDHSSLIIFRRRQTSPKRDDPSWLVSLDIPSPWCCDFNLSAITRRIFPTKGNRTVDFNNSCPFIFSRRQFRKEQVRRLARLKRTRGHNSPPFPSRRFSTPFPRPKIAVRLKVQGRGVHAQTYPYANLKRYLRADADRSRI